MRPLVFCDFDGTIITQDSCVQLSATWSRGIDWPALEEGWQAGHLSTKEVARLILQSVATPITEVLDHLASIPARAGLSSFTEQCAREGVPLIVVSDGYEVIIRRILAREGLDLPIYANVMYQDGKQLVADFPHASEDCSRCGCCKKAIIARIRAQSERQRPVVLIGDGRSDICAASIADYVFACGKLPALCVEAGIKHEVFSDFSEIVKHPVFTGV
jgi:2,3-diketo-5-methylthio-1-phosphopentane phosphatase